MKAIDRKVSLFVSRISVDTTLEDFTNMAKAIFPEAECEKLQSKHPDKYSSFKTTIDAKNIARAKERDAWPNGAYVSKFFRRSMGERPEID